MKFSMLFLAVALVLLAVVSTVDAKVCTYRDACNKRIIRASTRSTFTDSCRKSYKVFSNCNLRRYCYVRFGCSGKIKGFLIRTTFRDSCRVRYYVTSTCKLIRR